MKRSDIPALDDLRAFETVARVGSVRAAADELALTHAAVSRRVARLAEAIGAPLFARAGRGVRLTDAGDQLSAACRRSFNDLSETIGAIREAAAQRRSTIVLSSERSVATCWLIRRLSQFHDAHPEITLHLSVGGGPLDARKDRGALALRRLDFPIGAEWRVQPLFDETIGPVVAPGAVEQFCKGAYVALGARTRPDAWSRWLDAHPSAPRPKRVQLFDHHFLMVEASLSGLGVGLAPFVLVTDQLSQGRLAAPLGFTPDGSRYGLLHTAQAPLAGTVERLAEWLQEQTRPLSAPTQS